MTKPHRKMWERLDWLCPSTEFFLLPSTSSSLAEASIPSPTMLQEVEDPPHQAQDALKKVYLPTSKWTNHYQKTF